MHLPLKKWPPKKNPRYVLEQFDVENSLVLRRIIILRVIYAPISNRLIRQRLKNPKLGYIRLSLGLHLDCCRGISEMNESKAFC